MILSAFVSWLIFSDLIKSNKAHLLTSIEDIEYIMNWESHSSISVTEDKYYDYSKLSEVEKIIIELLKPMIDGMILDELSWKSQIPLNKLASILLSLEFNGIVLKTNSTQNYVLKTLFFKVSPFYSSGIVPLAIDR